MKNIAEGHAKTWSTGNVTKIDIGMPEEQERLLIQHHYLHSAGSAGETLRMWL